MSFYLQYITANISVSFLVNIDSGKRSITYVNANTSATSPLPATKRLGFDALIPFSKIA